MCREAETSAYLSSSALLRAADLACRATGSHEAWSKGLTPPVFWEHADEILSASRDDVDEVIARILASSLASLSTLSLSAGVSVPSVEVRSTGLSLRFAVPHCDNAGTGATTITVATSKTASSPDNLSPTHLVAKPGKAGYNTFFSPAVLSPTLGLATDKLRGGEGVLIEVLKGEAQGEANDLGVAIALLLLCAFPHSRLRGGV